MSGAGPASPGRSEAAPLPSDRKREAPAAGSPIQPIIKGEERGGGTRAPGPLRGRGAPLRGCAPAVSSGASLPFRWPSPGLKPGLREASLCSCRPRELGELPLPPGRRRWRSVSWEAVTAVPGDTRLPS